METTTTQPVQIENSEAAEVLETATSQTQIRNSIQKNMFILTLFV